MLNQENVLIIPWTEYYESHDHSSSVNSKPLADQECEKGPDASPKHKGAPEDFLDQTLLSPSPLPASL